MTFIKRLLKSKKKKKNKNLMIGTTKNKIKNPEIILKTIEN